MACVLAFAVRALGQVSFGLPEKINESWKFRIGDDEHGSSTELNDSRWQHVELPHDWSVKEQLSPTLASAAGYLPGGTGWYRKHIAIPEDRKGEKVYLYFEGVYNRSEVYVNGQLLGQRPSGYASFMYDATPYIIYGGGNIISVRVDHSRSADSRWYTGSGIYRNVWLVYADPVHIAQWGVYVYPKSVKGKNAVMAVEVEIENGSQQPANLSVRNELLSPDGKIVATGSSKVSLKEGSNAKISADLKVSNARLWSIDTPELYTLRTTVSRNGRVIDRTETQTGIRTLAFDPNKGFALNGQRMKVKGVCLHHDAGVLGAAVPPEVWKSRLLTLKETGCNAIRTSHNPQSPDLYALCDELGMLVIDEAYDEWEFPKRKWLEGWNVGTPGYQGSYDFFGEWSEKDLADMVRRDRNHISIFAWSIGNEVDYPNDPYSHPALDGGGNTGFTQAVYGGYKKDAPDAMRLGEIAKRLVAVVKRYDNSRPVTAGLAGVAMSNQTEYPGALDIAGYNYTENRYEQDHRKYPQRVIYGSENRHELSAWKAVRDNEYIFGQFLWTGIDYLGESGRWPSRGFYSGLIDFGGFLKPRGHYRQALWADKPVAYLGTYPTPGKGSRSQMRDVWSQTDAEAEGRNYVEKIPSMDAWPVWNYEEGQSIRVVCYTNASSAQLKLNGQAAGERKNYDNETGIIYWDIPYIPGKLEVTGFDNAGGEVSRYAIQSSKRPHALTAEVREGSIHGGKGVAAIVVRVVDEDGIHVMLSEDEITCRISGPGKLLGMEAGNNADMNDYTDNRHRVYNGRILVYVQCAGTGEEVKVRLTSPWLKPAEVLVGSE